MPTTLSQGGTTITPDKVLGYDTDIPVNNIFHKIIGREQYPDVTLRTPGLRTGTLSIFCLTEALASAVVSFHSALNTFTLEDSTWPSLNMKYTTKDNIGVHLDAGTGRWVVSVGYQELPNGNTPVPPVLAIA